MARLPQVRVVHRLRPVLSKPPCLPPRGPKSLDDGFGPTGRSRSRSCAVVILASAPTRSDGVSGIQGTLVLKTNRWSGAPISTTSSPQDHHVDPCAQWRRHVSEITLCQSCDFDRCFAAAVSDQFRACCADQSSGGFDAPFSEPELVRALAHCSDSATGRNGLPHSAVQVNLDWWRQMMLDFFQSCACLECCALRLEIWRGRPSVQAW